MAWITGTSTNWQTLMDALFQAMNRLSVQTATVHTAGTGYVVGDILTVSGGTSTVAATVRVTSAPGGIPATVAIANAGVYTTSPGTSNISTSGGTGSGCTLDLTVSSNGWLTQRATNVAGTAQSATVGAGGTGYTVGDVLTVSGGTPYQSATFTVVTAPGGIVGTVALLSGGDYIATPANNAATTGGTGTSCTLSVTYGTAGSGSDREFISKGTGLGGTDAIYCGCRTFLDAGTTAHNWELAGMTGFNSGLTFANQPGISPGRYDGGANNGAYVPLSSTSNTYWFSINGRRVIGVVKIGTAYLSFHMGFLNPYATSTEYPYPMYIAGTTGDRFALPSSTVISIFSIANPQNSNASASANVGAGILRDASGAWNSVNNANFTGSSRAPKQTGFILWPTGVLNNALPTGADAWYTPTNTVDFQQVIPQSGAPGTRSLVILRTDNSPAFLPPLFPCTVISSTTGVIGEVDSLFWFDASGGIVSEDTLTDGTQQYRVFQGGNQTDVWSLFAVKEN